MKKFFSLVLALVMALSLTTVAWGATTVATVNGTEYDDLQEAIKAASPSGTVEIVADVTVDTWVMFSQNKTIGNGKIITLPMDGLTINGNGKTLTVNNVESAGNGGYLFDNAEELNINNLTIKMNCNAGGIDLKSGTIDTVTFEGGNCIFPDDGEITVNNCTFNTAGYVIYYEAARNDLVVTNNTFNVDPASNVMILYGAETFTGNTVNSGRTVNVVSDTATVSGNNFVDTRVKLYNDGQTLSDNSFGEDAYIDIEDDVTDVDVSGNYWGGGAPSADQIPAAIADKVTVDTYATAVAADGTTSGLVSAAGVPMNAPANCNTKPVSLKDCVLVDLTNGAVLATFEDTDKATVYDFNDITTTTNGVKTTEYGATVYYFDGVYGLVVAKDYANAQLQLANGKFVYLRGISVAEFANASGRTTVVVDKFVDKADDTTKCGAATEDYAVVGKKFYAAEGDTLAYYKGEFVLIGAELDAEPLTPHGFMTGDEDCKWSAKDNKLTSVKCTCDDTFKVVQDIKGLKAGSYYALGDGNYVVLKATYSGGTVVTPSTDKTVTSAETFDAGIAMYVGMSVMAAAGSVVVLKKRED